MGRLVRVAPSFRLGLRKIHFADAARLQSGLELLDEAQIPGERRALARSPIDAA